MLRKVERFQQTKQEWPKAIGYIKKNGAKIVKALKGQPKSTFISTWK